MLEVTKKRVDERLKSLGILISYSIKFTDDESTIDKEGRVVYINPKDGKYGGFIHPSSEHLLAHEIGHIYFWHFIPELVTKSAEFQNVFGEVYKHYKRDMTLKHELPYFISTYAQTHPRENFAEVFSVYVTLKGNMRKIRGLLKEENKNQEVLRQFEWLNSYVKNNRRGFWVRSYYKLKIIFSTRVSTSPSPRRAS